MRFCTNCGLKLNMWTIPITFTKGVSGGKVSCPSCLFILPGTWATCWNTTCNGIRFCRENNPIDPVSKFYGNCCPVCLKTIIEHPMFGKDMDYDLAVKVKRDLWNLMVAERPLAASAVYRHHGFLTLSKKMASKIGGG